MNNTLLKGLAVLELLSRADQPMGITDIGRELGMVKSNVHRLIQALLETHLVVRDSSTGRYSPSIKMWELGSAVLGKLDLRLHADSQMVALMELTGETTHLSVLDGNEVVYVHKVDSANPIRAYTQIGGRAPAHCVATGKTLLAFSPPTVVDRVAEKLSPYTPRTITSPVAFFRELQKVRVDGYAVNRGEWRDDVWGIAAPITDTRGSVIAAIGISGPAVRFRSSVIAGWAAATSEAAAEIQLAVCGQPHTPLSRARLGVGRE